MKTYKTWEMMKVLLENPTFKFKLINRENEISVEASVSKFGHFNAKVEPFTSQQFQGNIRPDDEWELIQEPVNFMTAANSGKKIKCEILNDYHSLGEIFRLINGSPSGNIKDLLNGKWYIEE